MTKKVWQITLEWEAALPDRFDPELAGRPGYADGHKVFHATRDEVKELFRRLDETRVGLGDPPG